MKQGPAIRLAAVGGILFLASAAILMMSPLNPVSTGIPGVDSGIYKYVASVMADGGMPYRDVFDHKPPLVFLLNWLGQAAGGYGGTWFLELAFMATSMAYSYMIARMWCGRGLSLLLVVLLGALYREFFNTGNFTEEYAILFIAVSTYVYLDFFANGRVTAQRLFFCGFSFGAVFLLRANMVATWAVFSLGVLAESLSKRDGRLPWYAGWFLAGLLAVLLPVLAWLGAGGALRGFFDDAILFNLSYALYSGAAEPVSRAAAFWRFLRPAIVLGAVACLVLLMIRRVDIRLNALYLAAVACTLLSVSVSGRTYSHYGMILIPLTAYPYARLLAHLGPALWKRTAFLALVAAAAVPGWTEIAANAASKAGSPTRAGEFVMTEGQRRSLRIVEENAPEGAPIAVVGCRVWYHVLSGRPSVSKYPFQFPPAFIDARILERFRRDLEAARPAVVVLSDEIDRLDAVESAAASELSQYEKVYEWSDANEFCIVYVRRGE